MACHLFDAEPLYEPMMFTDAYVRQRINFQQKHTKKQQQNKCSKEIQLIQTNIDIG